MSVTPLFRDVSAEATPHLASTCQSPLTGKETLRSRLSFRHFIVGRQSRACHAARLPCGARLAAERLNPLSDCCRAHC
jgi:hypothetical protein